MMVTQNLIAQTSKGRIVAMAQQAESARRDSATSVCVLFDPKNGNIAHIHRCVVFPGGKTRSEEELAAKTKELAAISGRDIAGLRTLHLSDRQLHPQKAYRIDLDKLEPIEIFMKLGSGQHR
jgi:hypothetical protein